MGAVLISVVRWAFSFVLQGTFLKVLLLTAIYFLLTAFGEMMVALIPSWISDAEISSKIAEFPPGVKYFLNMMALDYGFPLMASSAIIRFMIRRLPIIG